MKIYLKIGMIFLLAMSCQNSKNNDTNLSADAVKESASKKKDLETSAAPKSKTILTKAQFTDFFPEKIGDYKLKGVSVLMSNTMASALYLKDNNYSHSMTYSLEDGNRKSSAVIQNFKNSYEVKLQGPKNTEYIYKERDGQQTIAFLQPTIKRNEISFVYNNRFRLTLEGGDSVEAMWSNFDVKNLNRLDIYQ